MAFGKMQNSTKTASDFAFINSQVQLTFTKGDNFGKP